MAKPYKHKPEKEFIKLNANKYPFFGEQATGAMTGLCLAAIYLGRRHLVEVLKKVVGIDSTLDDKDEPVSYRVAVLSFLGGMVILMIFCGRLGMSWWLVPLFFGLYFLQLL